MAEELETREVEIQHPPDGLLTFYANHIALGTTAFDIRLVFGQVMDIKATKALVQQEVMVTLAWMEAKILRDLLDLQIKKYEEDNEPLFLPKISKTVIAPDASLWANPKHDKKTE
jgi:hypothetical protein